MLFPKVKLLQDRLGISKALAERVRGVMDGTIDPVEASSKTKEWLERCYNPPSELELKMSAIDELLGGFGVEPIYAHGQVQVDSYHMDVLGVYVNMGDSYRITVTLDHENERFRVEDMATMVERMERKWKIQL